MVTVFLDQGVAPLLGGGTRERAADGIGFLGSNFESVGFRKRKRGANPEGALSGDLGCGDESGWEMRSVGFRTSR